MSEPVLITAMVADGALVTDAVLAALPAALGSKVDKAALAWVIATDAIYGADLTGAADSTAAINNAASAAQAAGAALYIPAGTYKITSPVTFAGDVDAHSAVFNYTPAGAGGVAVQVGNPASQLFRASVWLPRIVNTKKTTTGWAQTGVSGSVGVQVSNAYGCSVTTPWVNNFETGLKVTGTAAQGTQQCSFFPLHLDNNKVNLAVTPLQGTGAGDSGWANQNWVFGGRLSHNSSEGTQVAGTRHVLMSDCFNIVNGWVFYGTSLETPDVIDYHVETYGLTCTFSECRWENSGGTTHERVWSRGVAAKNRIRGGVNAGQITQTVDGTARPFDMDTDVQFSRRAGNATSSTLLLENENSSTAPVLTIMEAGAALAGSSPATAWAVKATAQQWAGKRAADANARLIMDYLNGRIYVGDATAAPTGYIGGSASVVFVDGLPFCPHVTATQDLGLSSLKWRDGWFSRNVDIAGTLKVTSSIGFYGTTPAAKPTVTGSRGGNAALASLLTGLAGLGLITDSSTA